MLTALMLMVAAVASADERTKQDADARRQLAAAEFKRADADDDGELTLDEFLASTRDADRAERNRRFLVFDFDASETLDGEEYRASGAPADERGDVPDPIVDLETIALAKWEAIFTAADGNADGALSRNEWPAKRITAEIPALAELSLEHWDRANDGQIDRADGRWLLDVAYGLAQLDGRPLRTKTGRVFSWYYFRHLDAGDDGLVSEFEFRIRHNQGQARNAEVFAELDANGDRQLTDRETWSLLWHDTIGQFLDYDRDRDGYLTADEMEAIGWGRSIARQCVPAFDGDRDGRLSFREFRRTTFANQAAAWPLRQDTDRDGRLSWKEFYTERPPLLIGQYRLMFDRFDRNHDGFLSVLEFAIEGDHQQAQLLTFVGPLERRLPLEVGFIAKVCRLSDDQTAALEAAGYDAIERIAGRLSAGRGRNNAIPMGRVVVNGRAMAVPQGVSEELVRAPHLLLRRELSEALQVRCGKRGPLHAEAAAWPDAWERYAAEREKLDERRRQAAVRIYVAVLDDALFLSGRQRRKLLKSLGSDACDGWWQPTRTGKSLSTPLEALQLDVAVDSLGGMLVPGSELSKHLTAPQLTTMYDLRELHIEEVVCVTPVADKGAAPQAGGGVALAGQRAQRVLRILRRGPPVKDILRRLAQYLDARVDQIDAACGLTPPLCEKLRVAGRIDIGRFHERLPSPPPEELAPGEEVAVQRVNVKGAVPLPLEIFRDTDSYFRRCMQSRLSDEQKERLAAAERERQEFQRQALVEALVAGFEMAASLTADQYDGLAAVFNAALADEKGALAPAWRFECLRRISQLPEERLRPIFFDFQWPSAREHQTQLAEVARRFEAGEQPPALRQLNPAVPVRAAAGGGVF